MSTTSKTTNRTTAEQRSTFVRDGVVHVPGAVGPDRIAQIQRIAEQVMARPSSFAADSRADGKDTGRMFADRYLWQSNDDIRDFVLHSGVGAIAGELMRSERARFYFDHTLIKEPRTPDPTPWHQDIPYWPFLGSQIASVWVTATDLSLADSALEFLRGSHLWNRYYVPKAFTGSSTWAEGNDGDRIPDIEAAREDFDIVSYDLKAGDALVFSAWIVHAAPGNSGPARRVALSTRWLGDDAIWDPRAASDPTITQADTTAVPGEYPADDARFPIVWERA